MDQFQQRPFKLGEGRGGPFDGGVITVRDAALIPFGGYSTMDNVKKWHPGMQKRRGMDKLHSTVEPGELIEVNPVFDGYSQNQKSTWAVARTAPAQLVNNTGIGAFTRTLEFAPGSTTIIQRGWLDFDNIVLPPGAIVSASLTLTSNSTLSYSGNFTVVLSTKPFGSLITADHASFTGLNLGVSTPMNNGIAGEQFVMPFTAAGLSYLDTTVRSSGQAGFMFTDYDYDYLNIPSAGVDSRFIWRTVDHATPGDRPLLSIQMAG